MRAPEALYFPGALTHLAIKFPCLTINYARESDYGLMQKRPDERWLGINWVYRAGLPVRGCSSIIQFFRSVAQVRTRSYLRGGKWMERFAASERPVALDIRPTCSLRISDDSTSANV